MGLLLATLATWWSLPLSQVNSLPSVIYIKMHAFLPHLALDKNVPLPFIWSDSIGCDHSIKSLFHRWLSNVPWKNWWMDAHGTTMVFFSLGNIIDQINGQFEFPLLKTYCRVTSRTLDAKELQEAVIVNIPSKKTVRKCKFSLPFFPIYLCSFPIGRT